MINYEVMFIVDPILDDEKRAAAVDNVKAIIEAEGTIDKVDIWGMRKLAYPIRKKNEGFYVVIGFQAGPDLPKELDRKLKIFDDIMRHLIINKDEK